MQPTQTTARRKLLIRVIGVMLLILSAWMAIHGHEVGAIQVGTRRSELFLSGEDMWLGYAFWGVSALLAPFLIFIDHAQTQLYRALSIVAGTMWFVTFVLSFLVGAHLL